MLIERIEIRLRWNTRSLEALLFKFNRFSIDRTPEIDLGPRMDGWMLGNNKNYPGLEIARLSDRGRELPRENTIRCKVSREPRERRERLPVPICSADPSHLFLPRGDWFCARTNGLSISKGNRMGTRRTSRSTDTCLVTRARCHVQARKYGLVSRAEECRK